MAVDGESSAARRNGKSAAAFRTISEVADDLEVPPHVLRFWETKFSQVRPLKRGGGRRYYRPEDVALLRRIRELLYSDGYTIKGVQRLLKDGAIRPREELEKTNGGTPPSVTASSPGEVKAAITASIERPAKAVAETDDTRRQIREVLDELVSLKRMMEETRN